MIQIQLLLISFLSVFGFFPVNVCHPLQDQQHEKTSDTIKKAVTLVAPFKAFDTTITVQFVNTSGEINSKQRKNYEGFIEKQGQLTPAILHQIFQYYKKVYPDYKTGWSSGGQFSKEELEKYLPTPRTPEQLKAYIKPAFVRIQNKQTYQEGTLAILFTCTWDVENDLGVLIKNWKVAEVGLGELVVFD
jgi:hypothetical protein